MYPEQSIVERLEKLEKQNRRMKRTGLSLFVIASSLLLMGQTGGTRQPPSISYGSSPISLGLTLAEVQQRLAGSSRHIELLPGDPQKATWIIYTNAPKESEGQVTIRNGKVVYADYTMPDARDADE